MPFLYKFTFKNINRTQVYKLIDDIFKQYELAGKNIVYFELLSIGQEISNSESTDKLIVEIENALK